jgi:hypothetical protein
VFVFVHPLSVMRASSFPLWMCVFDPACIGRMYCALEPKQGDSDSNDSNDSDAGNR